MAAKFFTRKESLGLVADVDDDSVGPDLYDPATDDVALGDSFIRVSYILRSSSMPTDSSFRASFGTESGFLVGSSLDGMREGTSWGHFAPRADVAMNGISAADVNPAK